MTQAREQEDHAAPARPNILFILIDDLGWKDLGCSGSRYYETPNIDALAASGVRFTNAYSSSPVCFPSRGAIYSGKNPARTKYTSGFTLSIPEDKLIEKREGTGIDRCHSALQQVNLPMTERLFSDALQEAGYATGHFGKWHLGFHPNYGPDKRGFQVAKGFRTIPCATLHSRHWGKTYREYGVNMGEIKDDDYVADLLTDECINFIRTNKHKPFLAVLSHFLFHHPFEGKPELVAKYQKKATTDQCNPEYAAMVESVDESVGRLVATLQELNLDQNTLVVFTSDNGGWAPPATSNYPLMGGKAFPFEAGMRVPLIASWPAVIKPGRIIKERTIGMDFYPTFLEAVGAPLRPEQHVDGVSLMSVFSDSTPLPERPLLFHYPTYTGVTSPYSSIIEDNWKLIHFYNNETNGYLLFDLGLDPDELNDLSEAKPELVERLYQRMAQELKAMNAEAPIPNSEYDSEADNLRDRDWTYNLAKKLRAGQEEMLKATKNSR
ncbi:sulfatase [Candidatus Sumerlaeota bacterium]